MLISDINSLRMELCRLRSQLQNYESLLGHNRKSKDQASSSLKGDPSRLLPGLLPG